MRQIKIPRQRQLGAQKPRVHQLTLLGPDTRTVIQNTVAPVDSRGCGLRQTVQPVHRAQRTAQRHGLLHRIRPRALQVADRQVVVHRRCGDLRRRARLGGGLDLAQNAAAQAQQALTPAQKILLAGQIAALPQCRAVDRHADIGRVVRQADKQIVLQRTAALGIGAQQVLRRKNAGRAVRKFGVQLLLAAGQCVQQPRRRGVDADRVGAAVHTVHQRRFQHGQPDALHPRQHKLRDQLRTSGQRGQRHTAAQCLAVQLKQPRFDGQAVRARGAALQKRVLPPIDAVPLHRADGQKAAVGVAGQRHVAVAPDGRKVERPVPRHRFQQTLSAHQRVLHRGLGRRVQRRQAAAQRVRCLGRQAGLVLGKDRAAELADDQRRHTGRGILARARHAVVQIKPFPHRRPHFD